MRSFLQKGPRYRPNVCRRAILLSLIIRVNEGTRQMAGSRIKDDDTSQ
jgi:hypothetical protein